jgi:hypothetical protein
VDLASEGGVNWPLEDVQSDESDRPSVATAIDANVTTGHKPDVGVERPVGVYSTADTLNLGDANHPVKVGNGGRVPHARPKEVEQRGRPLRYKWDWSAAGDWPGIDFRHVIGGLAIVVSEGGPST